MIELIEGPVGQDVLAGLEDDGLHGLALLYGGLRRPAADEAPLLDREDWNGTRFRGPQLAGPASDHRGTRWHRGERRLRLGGADERRILGRGRDRNRQGHARSGRTLRFVTANVALWPKVETIVINQKRWDTLTDDQRSWLDTCRAAARSGRTWPSTARTIKPSEGCVTPASNSCSPTTRSATAWRRRCHRCTPASDRRSRSSPLLTALDDLPPGTRVLMLLACRSPARIRTRRAATPPPPCRLPTAGTGSRRHLPDERVRG